MFTVTKADGEVPEEMGEDEELTRRELRLLQEAALAEKVATSLTASGV
ncbi:MAG: hypothetical protein GWN18_20735, partial [Thermoplasmata archaeon]|nr:hypothetical protein [Thermoplasmata archaeon]NIS14560.1 hypothetical protein [Thermoplasmata archaeon]NIS22392.1 hypothetical protein [Thermoplasmata archaeon]NIT80302.1 hypothetical protein [Thermoplasmata archaeon]NIU51406.1 hypothetical protein [Thermoplasmata archaeon]